MVAGRSTEKESAMSGFALQVASHRPMLVRTARRMLRNDAWAEDAVSETMLAALEKPQSFAGAAQLRTWLVAILKHKAVDQLRHHTRERRVDERDDDPGDAAVSAGPGAVIPAGVEWDDPQERVSRLQFFSQLDACLKALPPRQGQAFVLHDGMEKETAEICDELGITANNLSVMLHRARHRLRAMLRTPWGPVAGPARLLATQI
jgi:RNA polymerase sigma-70 factor, ECF subfamily